MTRIISAFVAASFIVAPGFAFAGGRDAMFYPNGKTVSAPSGQGARATSPSAAAKTKYKVQHGKAAPVPPTL